MSRIVDAFAASPNGKAFIPFITAGDPTLEVTEELVVGMAAAGADLIELGIPFSDPTAEGPVIQDANLRALRNRVTTDDVFAMVARVRQRCDVPLVIMTYANVVFSYGIDRFAERQAELGMGGVILPDVPHEEKEEFSVPFAERGAGGWCTRYPLAQTCPVARTAHARARSAVRRCACQHSDAPRCWRWRRVEALRASCVRLTFNCLDSNVRVGWSLAVEA